MHANQTCNNRLGMPRYINRCTWFWAFHVSFDLAVFQHSEAVNRPTGIAKTMPNLAEIAQCPLGIQTICPQALMILRALTKSIYLSRAFG